ncbi:MAG: hypothetical protein K9K66_09585 [Desulfarculaceae bacterium]|nr:hypothetical protein [Desulfarculaceae bacterium]MCF8073016.1 hypothetical protein [Desulfarculaceae bacterium]MCF8101899.1 hypothetical protein [Desulfarculaceae bacterium]MCF8115426.1 hypothetical protein [Desulfarculaceae bacterium]
MSPDRTCKRCSVARVNALTKAYARAHEEVSSGKGPLLNLVQLANRRGYADARKLLTPGLSDKEVRAACWNVSSFLEDEEVETVLGIKL